MSHEEPDQLRAEDDPDRHAELDLDLAPVGFEGGADALRGRQDDAGGDALLGALGLADLFERAGPRGVRAPYLDLDGEAVDDAERDRDGMMTGEAKPSWAYADNAANDNQERDRVVDRAVARIFAARPRQEAVGRNRQGDFAGARHGVEATARRIRGYAGRDPELRQVLADLEGAVRELGAPMRELLRKDMFAQSSYQMRSRMAAGQATRDRDPSQQGSWAAGAPTCRCRRRPSAPRCPSSAPSRRTASPRPPAPAGSGDR